MCGRRRRGWWSSWWVRRRVLAGDLSSERTSTAVLTWVCWWPNAHGSEAFLPGRIPCSHSWNRRYTSSNKIYLKEKKEVISLNHLAFSKSISAVSGSPPSNDSRPSSSNENGTRYLSSTKSFSQLKSIHMIYIGQFLIDGTVLTAGNLLVYFGEALLRL